MPFALPILLLVSVCVQSISGNDVNNKESTHAHIVSTPRPLSHRNQTKSSRNDQLLSLLAARRREIIQKRFQTHIKNIVDISSGNTTSPLPKQITSFPNATKTVNIHLNLSDILLQNNKEQINIHPSTETNVVNVSSSRKNADSPQIQENKNTNKNMPIIRNILYRRKMNYLNRKLPLDLEHILSDINKNPEDLILDNEDSLQVEESSHDKLIYYDVKNNASKKSGNNFEDLSDEIKSMTMNNKTVLINRKQIDQAMTTISPKINQTKHITAENTTKSIKEEKPQHRNNTRFMSPSLYSYFRPLDVPEEEMQPFLRFGEKLPNKSFAKNQSLYKTVTEKKSTVEENVSTVKNEEEVHENMDVAAVKPLIFENKIARMNLPNQKVTVARDYFKNRNQNKSGVKSTTENTVVPKIDKQFYIYNTRNTTRNRGFRNTTIFVQNKRSGVRHTINLKRNSSLANLKPGTTTELIQNSSITTTNRPVVTATTSKEIIVTILPETTVQTTLYKTTNNKYNNVTKVPTIVTELSTLKSASSLKTETGTTISNITKTTQPVTIESTTTTTTTSTTIIPTKGVFSTAVVTSVSVESSKSRANKTETETQPKDEQIKTEQSRTTTEINDNFDATVISALNNFTLQGFQNKTPVVKSRINFNISFSNVSTLTRHSSNKVPFILRPTTTTEVPTTSSEFIIHVPDIEISGTEPTTEIETTTEEQKQSTIIITTPNTSTTSTTEIPRRIFNTTVLTRPEAELELPLATLFSVTDFRKPDKHQNTTKIFKTISSDTVISRKSDNDVSIENIHAAYILAALGFLPMMLIVIYVIRTVMKKMHKNIEDYEAEMHDSDKKSIIHPVARLPTLVLDPSNRWEFPRSKLRLQTLLGQGNFGQVWKAEADDLKGHVGLTRLVAVKTIKDGVGPKERDDLLKELAIMQKMGSHPNVVTLLGCCTDKEPYFLIMEYVMYGKLLTFLRDHRTRRDYYNFSDDAATLTAKDLTVFAYCVARGMEYLASKGIIHRDLAARNVLVDHNKLCKIADFGMSRDASATGGEVTEPRAPRNALPVRWMAIESLLYNVFTSKTDVWAFGVLLWEIVTLGSSPYANMSGREVMRLVSAGYRLERPGHCRPELYGVMASTWVADPAARPSFTDLRTDLAALLEQPHPDGSYVDLESFRADPTVYEIDNCTPRGNYFTVKSRFSEFECDI